MATALLGAIVYRLSSIVNEASPMPEPLLVRDVMRIGVPTCKLEDTVAHVAALMIDGGHTAVVVLDEEADTRGLDQRAHPGERLRAGGGHGRRRRRNSRRRM